MINLLKPSRLKKGSKIATVSLSWGGPGTFPERYNIGKQQLCESFGVEVVEMPNTLRDAEWLWRNPQARAADLMQALEDPSIDGILSTIGGEDSVRILPYLNVNTIKANPKLFMGYSDTTITHFAFLNAGIQSFYGPSIMAGIGENGGIPAYLMRSLKDTVFSESSSYLLQENMTGWTNASQPGGWANLDNQKIPRKLHQPMKWRWLQGNTVVSGPLIGGCMDVLEFLKGSAYWPAPELFKDSVLFFEIAENAVPARQFGYWLRNYGTLGILQSCKAILFARPGGSDRNPECFDEYDQVLLRIVRDECGLSNLPIITRMDFGHTDPMMVIPYGAVAEVDCVAKSIKITI